FSWKPAGTTPVAPTLVAGAPTGVITAMPTLSADAGTVAFVSNNVAGVASAMLQLYVGPAAGPFRLVTGSSSNTPQAGNVVQPDLTPDGTQIAYTLETTATTAGTDVPVGQPSSVLVARLADTSATVDQISAVGGIPVGGTSSAPAISETGRFTVYESDAGAALSGNAQFPIGAQIWSTERTLSVASTIDFGTIDVGAPTSPVAIPVTNPLTVPVAIGQIGPLGSGFAVGADTCSNVMIAPGGTCLVTVVFTAAGPGAATANLVIPGGEQTASSVLKATGRSRLLKADNPSVSFPTTVVGTRSDPVAATIRNAGSAAVTIGATALQGNDPGQFVVVSTTCAGTLAVNATCSVSVAAQPSTSGSKQASLVVSGSSGESASVALSVVAFVPTTTTTRPTTTTTVRPGKLSASPASLTFPTTPVDVTSDPLTVTVANAGGSAVAINEVSISGGTDQFSVTDDACRGTQLGVGRTCTVDVVVRPTGGGEVTASLIVRGSRGESTTVTLLVDSSYAPAITITPGVVRRGNLITIAGTSFPAERAVVVQLAAATGTGPALPLGMATTDAEGTFVARVVVPQNGIASGGWQVIVVDQPDFTGVRAPVLVDQDSPSPGAATGASGIGGIPRPGPALP
ncbi:MAG: choice-of-anchor D domain-containing protein, partial [Ilumatobacteraceae bacterium]